MSSPERARDDRFASSRSDGLDGWPGCTRRRDLLHYEGSLAHSVQSLARKNQMSAIPEPPTQEAVSTPSALNLASVLEQMLAVSDKVSDLIFSPGRPPQIELVGKLQAVPIHGLDKLTPTQ